MVPFIINGESTLLSILGGISKLDYYSQNINSIYTIIMQYQCNFNGVNNINIHMYVVYNICESLYNIYIINIYIILYIYI